MSSIDQDPHKENYQATLSLTSAWVDRPHVYSCAKPVQARKTQPAQPKTWIVGGAEYGRCLDCGDIVRINKPFLGSLHFCS